MRLPESFLTVLLIMSEIPDRKGRRSLSSHLQEATVVARLSTSSAETTQES
jgi:hypothetical protein